MGRSSQKVQTSNCKINKSWGCKVKCSDYSQYCCIVYLKITKRVKFSPQEKKNSSMLTVNQTYDDHLVIYTYIELSYCTPETNITLHVGYTTTKIIFHSG